MTATINREQTARDHHRIGFAARPVTRSQPPRRGPPARRENGNTPRASENVTLAERCSRLITPATCVATHRSGAGETRGPNGEQRGRGHVDPAFDEGGAPFIRRWPVSCTNCGSDRNEAGDQRIEHVVGLDASIAHGCEIEPASDVGPTCRTICSRTVRAATGSRRSSYRAETTAQAASAAAGYVSSRPLPSRGAGSPQTPAQRCCSSAHRMATEPSSSADTTGRHGLRAVGSHGRCRGE